ncbi:iron-sulfur cluster biosynthesis family protein [Paenibacillus sp. SC116]|uniref:iron-sulfur cluster biosynthesis family protein n=1 Tax=Paenibacillus sp. SC116 TaxID=2968986 RepID=UPI00215ABF34|nr:iron-sulfur cluster biosynthesis family protein [Paenibacillus sp. SC116]MCR8842859.1 iron-sulfur cluster biosynthesis family protein [Paenibacillus sp. SC116]
MDLQFTEPALQAIKNRGVDEHAVIKLAYDTEGCGCAVNGVPALWIMKEEDVSSSDELISSNAPYRIIIHRQHAVFYEDYLTLDLTADKSFRLFGRGQTYSNHVRCEDKRLR